MIQKLASKLGLMRVDEFTSRSLRARFRRLFQIDVGLYSYGCFDRSRIDPNTSIGRYCSFAPTARVFNRDHGIDFVSTTPYLYNHSLGVVARDTIEYQACVIQDDVWVGHNACITTGARNIGRGAVIAAGAIVTHDVPPYAIVAGVPAKTLRMRFDRDTIARIESSCWWLLTPAELQTKINTDPTFVFAPSEVGRGR